MSHDMTLFQLGMDLEDTPSTPMEDYDTCAGLTAPSLHGKERKDYFQARDGIIFAGTHLMIDFWGASNLDDLNLIEQALRESAVAAGATLLHIHLHHFTPNGGVSGVAVLAESHISIHTWPERSYAALDVFMCGDADPQQTIPVLRQAFLPERVGVNELLRGQVD